MPQTKIKSGSEVPNDVMNIEALSALIFRGLLRQRVTQFESTMWDVCRQRSESVLVCECECVCVRACAVSPSDQRAAGPSWGWTCGSRSWRGPPGWALAAPSPSRCSRLLRRTTLWLGCPLKEHGNANTRVRTQQWTTPPHGAFHLLKARTIHSLRCDVASLGRMPSLYRCAWLTIFSVPLLFRMAGSKHAELAVEHHIFWILNVYLYRTVALFSYIIHILGNQNTHISLYIFVYIING